ncbi:MAG: imidazole glycerol phosphate synthase subunit HisH [Bacteroidaceae bacterium]|nr:imidazole glycerol phosphate synthase subunit HisH [Bacteroidaceae bacterium]
MIAIVDYNTGNICSVLNALQRIGAEDIRLTDDKRIIREASHVLLPGVGNASVAMEELKKRELNTLIPSLTQPVLGICIGAQLMCRSSEEGNTECMGIFPTRVRRFPDSVQSPDAQQLKVPHMGWNQIAGLRSPLFAGISEGAYVYYVHSYFPELCDCTIASTDYGINFSGALGKDNFFGTQFHPEKSGSVGEQILRNFLALK